MKTISLSGLLICSLLLLPYGFAQEPPAVPVPIEPPKVVEIDDPAEAEADPAETIPEDVPISRTIKIAEDPRTIDPVEILPEILTKKVTADFKDWSLRELTEWLQQTLEVSVLLDVPSLSDEGISELEPVIGKSIDEPVYQLLERVLEPLEMGYYVEDEVLHLSSLTAIQEILVSETYNLTPWIELEYDPEDIVQLIINETEGPWEEIEGVGGVCQILGDVLFIRQTQKVQYEVQGLLQALLAPARQTLVLQNVDHLKYADRVQDATVTVDFNRTPFFNVIVELSMQTGIPMYMDEQNLNDEGINIRQPINLELNDVKLKTVFQALDVEPLPKNGRLYVTTEVAAEEQEVTAVYDVRDLSRDINEAGALVAAIINQTSGPWEEIEGVGGTLSTPKHSVLVVRQTLKMQREVAELLNIYREALRASKPREIKKKDPNEILTHYYRMPTEMAESLSDALLELVTPESWHRNNPDKKGTLLLVRSKPEIQIDDSGEGTAVSVPHSVLIVKQTEAVQQEVAKVIYRVSEGDDSQGGAAPMGGGGFGGGGFGGGGFGGGGFGGGAGFGSGFFLIEEE